MSSTEVRPPESRPSADVEDLPPPHRPHQLERLALPPHSVLIGVVSTLVGTGVLCLRNTWIFSIPIREDGDYAANSILVNQAVHFTLLVGNYSREGFNHPGPAYLYIQSFGQDIFYSFLHLVPARYNGQLIAVFALNSAMFVVATMIIYRHLRSWSLAVMAVAVVLLMTGSPLNWASSWMPLLYASAFFLAAVAGVSVAVGALQDLPAFTFSVCLLIHGHVAFIGIMGAYCLVVLLTWMVRQRHAGRFRLQLSEAKRYVRMSIAIAVLFALPILVDLAFHWPGQWALYWRFAHSNSQMHPHTIAQVAGFVAEFWPGGHVVRVLVLVAGVVAALLAVFDPDRIRRTFVLALLIATAVLSIEVAVYALKDVDYLSFTYVADFYYVLPPLLPALLVVEVSWRLRSLVPGARDRRPGRALAVSVAVVAIGALVLSWFQGSFYNSYRGDPALSRIAAVIKGDPARGDRAVAVSLAAPGTPTADWGDVTGVLVAASRDGYQPCVANPSWKFMMTAQYICSGAQSRQRLRIDVQTPQCVVSSGARPIFRDERVDVYVTHTPLAQPCPPTGSLTIPKSGAVLSGTQLVNAAESDVFEVTKVEVEVTGGSLSNEVVGELHHYAYGWLGDWNTATVPNGSYTLESVAYDSSGQVGHSPGVAVVVRN